MYDMYPDWGPSRNNPDNPMNREALRKQRVDSFAQRDSDEQRPDDN